MITGISFTGVSLIILPSTLVTNDHRSTIYEYTFNHNSYYSKVTNKALKTAPRAWEQLSGQSICHTTVGQEFTSDLLSLFKG